MNPKKNTPAPFPMSRRAFMGGSAGLAAATLMGGQGVAAPVRYFNLAPAPARVSLVGGKYPDTDIWAYNGLLPGPEIRIKQGERLRVDVSNGIPQKTTVHWHGMRLPNAMDGVPDLTQKPIPPNATFTYEFTPPDAGTFWYHPHVRASEQQGRGLYGPLIIEEAEPPKVDRDLAWVMDDWRLTKEAAISDDFMNMMDMSHAGRMGNMASLNGKRAVTFDVRSGERLRLRLINTANARIFGLKFAGHDPQIIALDGHPVTPHAPQGGRITLGPGQRADIILDCGGDPGSTHSVTDEYSSRNAYNFLDLVYAKDAPLRTSPLDAPYKLSDNPVLRPDLNNVVRHKISVTGGAMGGMQSALYKGRETDIRELAQQGKIWAINGVVAHTTAMEPVLTLAKGRTHLITMENDTGWPHPLHLHGYAFEILSMDGAPLPRRTLGDTVMLESRQTATVALVADAPGDWLFHCHILEHHHAGMSSVIRVT